jgi:hypothetical protein
MIIKDTNMTVKVTKMFVRENISTPFYERTAEDKTHITTTFTTSGKQISRDRILSADQLELSIVRVFETIEDYESFLADPVVASSKSERIEYNSINSIIEYPGVVEQV